MFEQFFEVDADDPKRFGYFFGLVIGTAIIVTVIYWAIFGFNKWEGQVLRTADLMMAATIVPTAPATGFPSGVGQSFPSGAGQYVCPRDGVAGLPSFDAAGCPHCPICGQVMGFNSAPSTNLTTAAAGAG
ncbi:MAG TPA: hypothetical protein HPP41_00180 [Deltaproteobacteria bacterium]|nr:hypothetical protein [Deltaproteobacteria bacterium]